ncbi:MAG: hypothetical protein M3O50_08075 [Myxococcota bacterium]|nr:hypothetical protein [Myxococcota bacterium]
MSRGHRSLALLAAAGLLSLVAGGPGCATGDCTETATCSDPSDAPDETAPDHPGDGGEASVVLGEAAALPDASMETDADGTDGGAVDAATTVLPDEPDGDTGLAVADEAGRDVASAPDATDAAVEAMGAGGRDASSGCIASGPEICNNGIDDDCNGLIDCADRVPCSGSVCADKVPTGWVGPALLWTGPYPASQIPACPTGFQAITAFQGLTFPNDSCSCSCSPTGQQCSASVTAYTDQACMNRCMSVTLASGGCGILPANTCQQNGSFQVTVAPSPGGTCAANVTASYGGAPSWGNTVRLCTFVGTPDSPGGCTAPGAQCVSDPAPFGSVCVSHAGAVSSCPSGYAANPPIVVYSGWIDQRGCTGCTCNGPTGASCSGTVSLHAGTICSVPPSQNGPACSPYTLNPKPGSARATYTLTPGTCSVASQPTPTGGVVPSGPTTICCR